MAGSRRFSVARRRARKSLTLHRLDELAGKERLEGDGPDDTVPPLEPLVEGG